MHLMLPCLFCDDCEKKSGMFFGYRNIRDENELKRIHDYIINNPKMWQWNRNNDDL